MLSRRRTVGKRLCPVQTNEVMIDSQLIQPGFSMSETIFRGATKHVVRVIFTWVCNGLICQKSDEIQI